MPSFIAGTDGIAGPGFNDMHLYPPDVLSTAGSGIAQVQAINPSITGKPGIITETGIALYAALTGHAPASTVRGAAGAQVHR